MAREVARLTAFDVKRAKARGLYSDGGGLYLQIDRNANRSWIFRYGPQGRRYFGLGPTHTITLAEAREKARDCRKLLLEGRDPIAEKQARKAAARIEAAKRITFAEAAETYITDHHAAWKNEKNRTQWRNTLRDYAYPVIGKLPVAAIDTGLVLRVLQPIWTTKTETAARVRMRIERILSWATVQGFRSGDNPARWDKHLDNLLPAQAKVAPVEHHPALPYAEVPAFLRDMRERDGLAAEAFEFMILTATTDRRDHRCHLGRDQSQGPGVDDPGQPHEGQARTPGAAVRSGRRHPQGSTARRRPGIPALQHGLPAAAQAHGAQRYHSARIPLFLP